MSIVQGIIKGFIGNWGMSIVDFYYSNSLWINGILLLYALVISISWRNYATIRTYLLNNITSQMEPKIKTWSKTEIARNIKMTQIPWELAKMQLKVPIIAKSGSMLPVIASKEVIEKLFPINDLIITIRDTKKKQEV
jgi:hypothetical protein